MAKKNILLLSMSTLRKNNSDNKTVAQSYYQENEGTFQCEGYSQMEPVPKLLMNKLAQSREKLDTVLILATPETNPKDEDAIEPVVLNGKYNNEEKLWSAVRVFEEGIREYAVETQMDCPDFERVPLEKELYKGISQAVQILREYKEESEIALYLDIHGGPRENQMMLEAILWLLRSEEIAPKKTYTVEMRGETSDTKRAKISEVSPTTVFTFAAGMTEFINYGRADSLAKYLEEMGIDKTSKEKEIMEQLIETIKQIADAIQLCDIVEFEKQLDAMQDWFVKYEQCDLDFFEIFRDNIKNDYGVLLDQNGRTALDELKWCARKGFYQQALTIIESRMPEYICANFTDLDLDREVDVSKIDEQGLVTGTLSERLGTCIDRAKEKDKSRKWQETVNYMLESCLYCAYKDIDDYLPLIESERTTEKYWEYKPYWELGKTTEDKGKYQIIPSWKGEDGSKGKCTYKCAEPVVIRCKDVLEEDMDKVDIFLQLHMSLKNQRNQVNHAAEQTKKREPVQNIFDAIHAYIDMVEYFTNKVNCNYSEPCT